MEALRVFMFRRYLQMRRNNPALARRCLERLVELIELN